MKWKKFFVWAGIVVLLQISLGLGNAGQNNDHGLVSMDRQSVVLSDITGKTYSTENLDPRQAIVLAFVTADCPIANSYQPALAKLRDEFHDQGIQFLLVHEGADQSLESLRKHAMDYSISMPIVQDPEHVLAQRVGATRTPEVVVISKQREILYRGRIDDLYYGFGKKRVAPTREDLRIALEEYRSGKSVSVTQSTAIGCSIPSVLSPSKEHRVPKE